MKQREGKKRKKIEKKYVIVDKKKNLEIVHFWSESVVRYSVALLMILRNTMYQVSIYVDNFSKLL